MVIYELIKIKKKSYFFSGPATFLKLKKISKQMWPISSRGGGTLVAGPLKNNFFKAFLISNTKIRFITVIVVFILMNRQRKNEKHVVSYENII